MKKKHRIPWILAVVGALFLLTQFSAMAADKVVVIPLFSSGDKIPTVTSKTGRVWMDRNLGAMRVARSKSDSLAYGWLYQWGRPADGHESRTSPLTAVNDLSNDVVPGHGNFILVNSSPNNWLSTPNDNLWQGVSGVNNPCPPGFRIPTREEWEAEIATWDSADAAGAYASPLSLALNGFRDRETGDRGYIGVFGYYWSTSVDGDHAIRMRIVDNKAYTNHAYRSYAYGVRCIAN